MLTTHKVTKRAMHLLESQRWCLVIVGLILIQPTILSITALGLCHLLRLRISIPDRRTSSIARLFPTQICIFSLQTASTKLANVGRYPIYSKITKYMRQCLPDPSLAPCCGAKTVSSGENSPYAFLEVHEQTSSHYRNHSDRSCRDNDHWEWRFCGEVYCFR